MQQSSHSFMRNGKNSFVYLRQIRRKLFIWYVGSLRKQPSLFVPSPSGVSSFSRNATLAGSEKGRLFSQANMLVKSTSDWIRRGKPERTCTIITAPFSFLDSIFCRLDPIAVVASTFRQLSPVRSLLYFQFLFASWNWSTDISMV